MYKFIILATLICISFTLFANETNPKFFPTRIRVGDIISFKQNRNIRTLDSGVTKFSNTYNLDASSTVRKMLKAGARAEVLAIQGMNSAGDTKFPILIRLDSKTIAEAQLSERETDFWVLWETDMDNYESSFFKIEEVPSICKMGSNVRKVAFPITPKYGDKHASFDPKEINDNRCFCLDKREFYQGENYRRSEVVKLETDQGTLYANRGKSQVIGHRDGSYRQDTETIGFILACKTIPEVEGQRYKEITCLPEKFQAGKVMPGQEICN